MIGRLTTRNSSAICESRRVGRDEAARLEALEVDDQRARLRRRTRGRSGGRPGAPPPARARAAGLAVGAAGARPRRSGVAGAAAAGGLAALLQRTHRRASGVGTAAAPLSASAAARRPARRPRRARSSSRRLAACSIRLIVRLPLGRRAPHEQRRRPRPPRTRASSPLKPPANSHVAATALRDGGRAIGSIDTAPSTGRLVDLRSVRGSWNVGASWLATKLAAQARAERREQRDAQQREAVRRHRLRRDARRIDDAELRAAGVLHADAHRRRLAPGEQRLVGLLLDVVVAVELRELGLDLRARATRATCSCAYCASQAVELRAQRGDLRLGLGERDPQLLEDRVAVVGPTLVLPRSSALRALGELGRALLPRGPRSAAWCCCTSGWLSV